MKVRFYCENCGNEVPFNAAVCPYCGKVFDAVKCPICGYEGTPEEFSKGCPKCGYLSVNLNPELKKGGEEQVTLSEEGTGFRDGGNINAFEERKGRVRISPLLFRIIVVILLAILFFLIYLLFRV